ncbi:hypothetical protein GQX73_g5943 [Xylaria multiplex]|uniref:DUF1279 domain-containing protein n=1 Tax=Xylaria multiplex TaxID=323545 RepID=A0A7C8ITH2_9PEZI|nr:hypothetical protein GQX73_g5943 [Xylaria multiplex]
MIRAYLRILRPLLQPSGHAVGLQNALGLETQPLRRAFTSISQPSLRYPISKFTQRINYRPRISNSINKSYQSPLRTNGRSFHKASRLRGSKPNPSKPNAQEPQGLSARLKKLTREYGWAAMGVYLSLSVLDFPFCFLLVRVVGTERIGELEHWLVSHVSKVIPDSVRNRWNEYRAALKEAKREQSGGEEEVEVAGWGVEQADERNKTEASLGTQLALAYAIHKSFIFLRVPLTVAVTPKVVKVLRSWVTRSHKYNDKDHAGLAEGTVLPQDNLPKFFAKHGFEGVDPKKTKKNGAGKGNWGNVGEEIVDEQFNFVNARRRSNSSGYSNHLNDFKTKFEFNEPEPVFEESVHGPTAEDDNVLTKTETSSSDSSSVDDNHRKSM